MQRVGLFTLEQCVYLEGTPAPHEASSSARALAPTSCPPAVISQLNQRHTAWIDLQTRMLDISSSKVHRDYCSIIVQVARMFLK